MWIRACGVWFIKCISRTKNLNRFFLNPVSVLVASRTTWDMRAFPKPDASTRWVVRATDFCLARCFSHCTPRRSHFVNLLVLCIGAISCSLSRSLLFRHLTDALARGKGRLSTEAHSRHDTTMKPLQYQAARSS